MRNRLRRVWALSLVASLVASDARAAGEDDAGAARLAVELRPEITAEELRAHVAFLASDELAGRDTGSPGERAAAEYLARCLREQGLEPGGSGGGFLREVALARTTVEAPPELVVRGADGSTSLETYREGFDVRFDVPATGPLRLLVVDADDPIDPVPPDPGVAVVLDGNLGEARRWLEAAGAADGSGWGLVIRSSKKPRPLDQPLRLPTRVTLAGRDDDAGARWVRAYEGVFERLASGEVESVELRTHVAEEAVEAFNVVGVIEGRGTAERPELAREAIVVSAHYDHIGTSDASHGHGDAAEPDGDEPEDRIFNGADDNASGTATVLELAGALAAGPPPARTVVFLLATGEEKGLLGTLAYLERPTIQLEDTIFNLNVEMVGRPDPKAGGSGRLWMVGWELTDLGPALAERGLAIVPDPRPEQRFFQRSDNIAFVRRGIVGQSLSSYSLHGDYHKPSDEADTLDYAHLEACVREALRALRPIADGELTPAWVGDPPFQGR